MGEAGVMQGRLFTAGRLDQFVPPDHPLRWVRCNEAPKTNQTR